MASLLAALASLCWQPCAAQGVFAGAWDVVGAQDAPWLAARKELKAHPEPLLRKAHFEFGAHRLGAPGWMGCKKPKYEMMSLPFDNLFEGGLSDPDHGLNNPAQLASKLGFTAEPVPSMLTGCTELLFHLVDKDTAVFGLNNMIYTLRRAAAR
ncbi:MAG: hypothetical protein V4582_23190 [Pseudomonadota bacterium]